MVQPVGDEATKEIRPSQNRTVLRRRAADDHVVTAARSAVAAVEHELVGTQAEVAGLLVERFGVLHELAPVASRMDVDFENAWIGRDLQASHAWIWGRVVPLDPNGLPERRGGGFDRRAEFEVVFDDLGGRHEHVEDAAARFDAQARAHGTGGRLEASRRSRGARRRTLRYDSR
jgi:hypothetical protein